jgi:hypothetical protein
MISDENALETFAIRSTLQAWRPRLGGALLAVAAIAARLARKEWHDLEADPFATEMPFVTDFWPRD